MYLFTLFTCLKYAIQSTVTKMREVSESNCYPQDMYLVVVPEDLKYVEHPLIWPKTLEARLYQQTIAEKACQKNTMVILPTALSKILISILAAVHFLYKHWDQKILVMTPTKPLVLQHRDAFSKFLRIKAEDMVVLTDKVPPTCRRHLWDGDATVFFATPQVVRNDLESGKLSLEHFCFLVFDECHRA